LLALHIFIIVVWVLCWRASICLSSFVLYPALAPGSWFIWIHRWAFLIPGFQLGLADGEHCQQIKERKEGEVKILTFFFPVGFLVSFLHPSIEDQTPIK